MGANSINPRCLVPKSYGVSLPQLQKTNLWEVHCTNAKTTPRIRTEIQIIPPDR